MTGSTTTGASETPLTMRDQLGQLWAYRVLLLSGVIVGLLGALSLSLLSPSSYSATADVLVKVTSQTPFPSGDATKQISMQTETQVARSQRVAQGVIKATGSSATPSELSRRLRVTNPPDTLFLSFAYADENPDVAAEYANAFADSYLLDRQARTDRAVDGQIKVLNEELDTLNDRREQLDKTIDATSDASARDALIARRDLVLQEVLAINARLVDARVLDTTPGDVVRAATPPSLQDGPPLSTTLLLGAVVGLGLSVVLAWILSWLRRGEPGTDPLSVHTGVEVLSTLRRLDLRPGMDDGKPLRASEPANTLALTLAYGREMEKVRSILVAETRATDGARSVAVDLSLALIEIGRNVALVEADFRLPMLATALPFIPNPDVHAHVNLFDQAERRVGLEWEEPSGSPLEVRVDGPGRLHLFPGGVEGRPLEALNRPGTQSFVAGLRDDYDFVVVVAPGLLTYVDGLELMHLMDGALLVSDARDWSGPDLEAAAGYVRRVGGRLVGAIRVVGSARIIA